MAVQPVQLSRDFVNLRVMRFARNQREAGIDHLEWEGRVKPLRPIAYDVGVYAGIASTMIAMLVLT